MFSEASFIRAAENGCFGGYLGLYDLAQSYGWDYISISKDDLLSKLKELLPYPQMDFE